MTYERVWTVRFSDTDPFGIAHYPRIVDALHETSDMFMEEIGWPYWELPDDGFGLPLVEMHFEFENPVEAGDQVLVELTPEPSTRSVRFDIVARNDGEVAFSGYEQRVCAEQGGGGSRPLPEDLRSALLAYAGDGA